MNTDGIGTHHEVTCLTAQMYDAISLLQPAKEEPDADADDRTCHGYHSSLKKKNTIDLFVGRT